MRTVKVNLHDLMIKRYPPAEYVLMREVSDAAGFARSRSADYIAFSLWPSRGLAITGFEVKASRSDWLRELKQPAKAENIFKYCDFFYLITTEQKVATLEEIPITWGWLTVNDSGKGLVVKKKAPASETPAALTRHFVAALLKRAADKTSYVHLSSIEDKIKEAEANKAQSYQREFTQLQNRLEDKRRMIAEFEKAAGIQFSDYGIHSPEMIGKTVGFIQKGGIEGIQKDLERLREQAMHILSNIEKVILVK